MAENPEAEAPGPFEKLVFRTSPRFHGSDIAAYIVDGKSYDPKDVMVVLKENSAEPEFDYNEYTFLREPLPGETGWKKE